MIAAAAALTALEFRRGIEARRRVRASASPFALQRRRPALSSKMIFRQGARMDFATMLYGLLSAGAALAATAGAQEFGKKAVATAFDAIKARLAGAHQVPALDQVGDPDFAGAVKAKLAKPEIAGDPELAALIESLRAALAAVPAEEAARYAVDVKDAIESAGRMTLADIEGLRARSITSGGDMEIRGVKAPPGKA